VKIGFEGLGQLLPELHRWPGDRQAGIAAAFARGTVPTRHLAPGLFQAGGPGGVAALGSSGDWPATAPCIEKHTKTGDLARGWRPDQSAAPERPVGPFWSAAVPEMQAGPQAGTQPEPGLQLSWASSVIQ